MFKLGLGTVLNIQKSNPDFRERTHDIMQILSILRGFWHGQPGVVLCACLPGVCPPGQGGVVVFEELSICGILLVACRNGAGWTHGARADWNIWPDFFKCNFVHCLPMHSQLLFFWKSLSVGSDQAVTWIWYLDVIAYIFCSMFTNFHISNLCHKLAVTRQWALSF